MKWFKKNLMPARAAAKAPLIADLDAMLVEPVGVRVLGKDYVIAPISNEQFFKIVKAWEELSNVRSEEKTPDVSYMLDKYFAVISIALPDLERPELDKMSLSQIASLLQIVVGTVTGETYGEKKTLKRIKAMQQDSQSPL